MKVLPDGRIRCRVRITGTYRGYPFEYVDSVGEPGSQFIDQDGDPSTYWWSDGNMSCDCNRSMYLPKEWNVPDDCGDEIYIDRIEPVDYDGPVLELNESTKGKS